jgi:hypothetical protein
MVGLKSFDDKWAAEASSYQGVREGASVVRVRSLHIVGEGGRRRGPRRGQVSQDTVSSCRPKSRFLGILLYLA